MSIVPTLAVAPVEPGVGAAPINLGLALRHGLLPGGWRATDHRPGRSAVIAVIRADRSGVGVQFAQQPIGSPLAQLWLTEQAEGQRLVVAGGSRFATLALGALAMYCPQTLRKPTREAGLAPELKVRLLALFANGFFGAVVIPCVILVLTFVAELAATNRRVTREDCAVGFDLLLAAVGSQVAIMGSSDKLGHEAANAHIELSTRFSIGAIDIDLEFGMLCGIMWIIIGAILWIRKYGTTPSEDLTWGGVIVPIVLGFIAVGSVYWVNARLLGAS
jgi:hypothetical protein